MKADSKQLASPIKMNNSSMIKGKLNIKLDYVNSLNLIKNFVKENKMSARKAFNQPNKTNEQLLTFLLKSVKYELMNSYLII